MISSDLAVVHAILNPNEPFVESGSDLDSKTERDGEELSLTKEISFEAEKRLLLSMKERDAIQLAEDGKLEESLELLDAIIEKNERYPSAYNNRAQVRQIMQDREGALKDLDEAIKLTRSEGEVAAMAYTQRGVIHRLNGNAEAAQRDLQQAVNLGSSLAKRVLVELNPYAALCNDMLSSMLQKCIDGEQMYC